MKSPIHSIKRLTQSRIIKLKRKVIKTRTNAFVEKERDGTYFNSASSKSYELHGRNFLKSFQPVSFIGKNNRTYLVSPNYHGEYESSRELRIDCTLPTQQAKALKLVGQVQESNGFSTIKLAKLSLGFERDALIIEAIQGRSGTKTISNEFWRTAKTPPLDFLLKTAEEHAKKLGLKQIKLRRPETLSYYFTPWILMGSKAKSEEIRANMRILYTKLAKKQGYTKEEFFYVKKL